MATLTSRRMEKIEPILEKYREQLFRSHRFDAMSLEMELRAALNGMWYQRLKLIAIELLKDERYQPVAAYYMQHQHGSGVVSEFKGPLAKLYGVRSYHSDDVDAKRDAYWDGVFSQEGEVE